MKNEDFNKISSNKVPCNSLNLNGFTFSDNNGFVTVNTSNISRDAISLVEYVKRVENLLKSLKSLNQNGFLEKVVNVPIVLDLI